MINVKFSKKSIHILGHANFDVYGSDIVCSAVSMITTTIANKLKLLNSEIAIELDEGNSFFEWEKLSHDEKLLIETLILGLEMIAENYSKYIKIEEVADV